MTNEEMQQRLDQHDREIADIRETLNRTAQRQEANMEQIALLTESLTGLRSLISTYISGREQR